MVHLNPPFDIPAALTRLPGKPGVYLMYDSTGQLLYIGKAKSLKSRVRQYFQSDIRHSYRIQSMVGQIARFETILTDSEIEALLLEDTLVKERSPKYNVLLRDDKKFPWIGLSDEPFPDAGGDR